MNEIVKVFGTFASSLRLSPPPAGEEGWHEEELASMPIVQMEGPSTFDLPSIWWRSCGELRFSAFHKKLQRWLQSLQVPSSDAVVNIIIGMIAIRVSDGLSLEAILQELKNTIKKADVTHVHTLSDDTNLDWSNSMEWAGFRFESLDSSKLVHRCRKAKSDRFEKKALELNEVPSIHSPVVKQQMLDWLEVCWRVKSSNIKTFGVAFAEHYLQLCAKDYTEQMWEQLEDAWLLPQALGLHLFDLTTLRSMPGSNTWTCISRVGMSSALSWMGVSFNAELVNSLDLPRLERSIKNLSARYQFEAVQNSTLHPLIRGVSRSLVRSSSHMIGGRKDESFLFLIIAIEQVFSEKHNTTQAVVSRTSLVAHLFLKWSFQEAQKKVSRVYDVRSKLVHGGVSVVTEDLLEANDLGEAVLKCLLRLARSPRGQDQNLHESWLKRLDYLVAGIEAGKPPSDADLIENGIIDSPLP